MSSVPPISIRQGADASIGFFSRMRWNLLVIGQNILFQALSKIVANAQEQGKSRRKSAAYV
jgi:hypothetical protein